MGQDIDELLYELNNEFTASNLSRLLSETGLISEGIKGRIELFSRLIFLYSDKDEIYSRREMDFIENVGNIILFPDFIKKVAKGNMNCRYIGVDLSGFGDDLYYPVMFMKILIKALSGFSIFIIKLLDGIHIGIRTFDKVEYKNCTLCESKRIEEVLEGFTWVFDEDFLDYYSALVEYVSPTDNYATDYDEYGVRRRGVAHEYIEALSYLATMTGISTSSQIDQYRMWFNETNEYTFKMQLDDCVEELKNIHSAKVNTLEMLFEAEELERLSADSETIYEETLNSQSESREFDDSILVEAGDNPEEMIRLLKLKHGVL
jgi:hypothetical protein|nr:MAG TPA: hypothetical protein [Inoviridae sp.]